MQSMTYNELKNAMANQEDGIIINVLSREKFNQAHIPCSISIPGEDADFIQTVEKVAGSKDRKIVLYCASFECQASPKAAEKLDQAGFTNVCDYEGGIKEWQEKERQQQRQAA